MRVQPLLFPALGVAIAALLASTTAQAQVAPGAKPRSSVGLAVAAQKSPYAGYDTDVLPIPVVNYEGKSFHLRGGSVGWKLFNSESTEVSLLASPYMMRFKHKDTDNVQLRQLSNRSLSAMAGVAVRHTAPWGIVQANMQAEVSGHGGGFAADAKYAYPIPTGKVTLVPGIGAGYASADLNDYYFGVSARESARSGLATYKAGSGVSPYIDLTAIMPLGAHWVATGSLRRTRLSDAITDSPMTEGKHMDSALIALSYGF